MKKQLQKIDWKGVAMLYAAILLAGIIHAAYEKDWLIVPTYFFGITVISLLTIIQILFEKPKPPKLTKEQILYKHIGSNSKVFMEQILNAMEEYAQTKKEKR